MIRFGQNQNLASPKHSISYGYDKMPICEQGIGYIDVINTTILFLGYLTICHLHLNIQVCNFNPILGGILCFSIFGGE